MGTNRPQEWHGEGFASIDLPAKKSHWISSQPWLKAFPHSVKSFCSKQSNIILCRSISREGLMESVLSTIMLLKIWIKNNRKCNQLAAGRDIEENQRLQLVSFSKAGGELIHSKYSIHKTPLFTSCSFMFRDKKPKLVPDLTSKYRFPPQNIEGSMNYFKRRKHTISFPVLVTFESETSAVLWTRAHS